ncbi:TPA: thioredoxin-disulfide reductase [Candidatus Uhrbacteria bacterium]|nr:thioredoxin-disulfide reductase [Candidatus Uhrbacteria bacterium]
MDTQKLIIIGSGPAGYTAAIYAARADLAPVLFTGQQPGGQLMLTSEVENWPGEADGVMGPDLMEKLKKQAAKFGTQIIDDTITSVDFSSRPFKVTSASNGEFQAESIIISTGASAKWLDIPGEKKLQGRGVSACATCDGFFFRDKKIIVVGGGDSAMEEATFLTKFAREVVIIVRTDKLRASKIMQEKAQKNPKISFLWNTSPVELIGEERLTGVKVVDARTKIESVVDTDGFFVAIGHQPNTKIFVPAIDVDQVGYIKHAPDSTATNIPGVFACGDVIDAHYRQAVTAAGSGCMAALQAERWLANNPPPGMGE